MLRTGESETEILLSNAQILGIFFVLAILLGIAFTGGYMVGRGSLDRKGAASAANAPASISAAETHAVSPEAPTGEGSSTPAPATAPEKNTPGRASRPSASAAPLGSEHARKETTLPAAEANDSFRPESGQTFLQVAAVGRDEAVAIADVLNKKGFRAHAVLRPGSPKLYRVLIGPIRDTADLSSLRDSLRKTGFREVITQKY